ncbi:MAG: hypothetical protein JRI43_06905 [Deltaproteobacteria bacterium]|nr:hypothetical protein [Deltaproteobacteria bacterium]
MAGRLSGDEFPIKIEVAAYSGYKANERPLYFIINERKLDVVNIIDRWYGVEHDYYKVLADDGRLYLLKWNRIHDVWFLVKMEPDTRCMVSGENY